MNTNNEDVIINLSETTKNQSVLINNLTKIANNLQDKLTWKEDEIKRLKNENNNCLLKIKELEDKLERKEE